jgi:hypothetical protein
MGIRQLWPDEDSRDQERSSTEGLSRHHRLVCRTHCIEPESLHGCGEEQKLRVISKDSHSRYCSQIEREGALQIHTARMTASKDLIKVFFP